MVGLLALGFALVHVADRGGRKISKDDAIAIARTRIDFEPTGYQIRFLRRGVPPRGYWITSFYIRKAAGGYRRVTVVVIDAASGRVTEVHRNA
jgi:Peptidase propeptide and YPEB domain